jgi:hypothetical protein
MEIKPLNLNEDSDEEESKGSNKSRKTKAGRKTSAAEDKGLLPDIRSEIYRFEQIITWKTVNKKKVPEPKEGLDIDFDNAKFAVE